MRLHISAKKNRLRYEIEVDGQARLLKQTDLRYLLVLAVAAKSGHHDGWVDMRHFEPAESDGTYTKYIYSMKKTTGGEPRIENDRAGSYRLRIEDGDLITFDWPRILQIDDARITALIPGVD